MKVAIMQPYFFPYIGYFQLIHAVDKFIIYDDVNYINRGWINRKNIMVNGAAHMIQVPWVGASQNKLINEIEIVQDAKWKTKLLRTIQQSYAKAPFFGTVFELIESTVNKNETNVSVFNVNAIKAVCDYIGIQTEIVPNSARYNNKKLKAQERILDICEQEKGLTYINPSGGMELYDKPIFLHRNINLQFLKPKHIIYKQFKNDFIPWLSIIDQLMFLEKEELNNHLNQYELI
ncbi:MAG: WbqC family protein [Bacteroidota bacterium]